MLHLTEGTKELLDQHFANKNEVPFIRVYMAVGCSGPQLGLALDEQKQTDDAITSKEYTFVVDKSLLQTAGPIEIHRNQFGFSISSNLNTGNSAQGCASCSSC